MWKFYSSTRRRLADSGCGQAAVEFALAATVLLIFMCAAVDFGRALNDTQILSELSRQGANLASRGQGTPSCDNLCTAIADLLAGDSGLGLATKGRVIVTSFTQAAPAAGGSYKVTEQKQSASGISATSKIAPSGSGNVSIAGAPALYAGQVLYTTEIFYSFSSVTPIGALTNNTIGMPTVLYNVAYF